MFLDKGTYSLLRLMALIIIVPLNFIIVPLNFIIVP